MIQINELRIGNLVDLGKIEQIDNSIDEVYYSGDGYYQSNYCCNLNPIPINEEWLLNFCFEKSAQNFDYFQRVKYFDYSIKVGFHKITFIIDEYGYLKAATNTYVKSVHQLQNLYFALVNSELQLLEAGI